MRKENKNEYNKRGAEAKVYFSTLFGVPVVIKIRDVKKYRISQLDEVLRKTRNRTEARCILHALRKNIKVPRIFHAGKFELILEKINGKLMKDRRNKKEDYIKVGEVLSELHSAGITHGDFTPANIMFTNNGPFIIDFGLAEFSDDLEERAVDVLLMKRSIGKNFKYFLEGYKKLPEWNDVIKKMDEIEKRGRYYIRKKLEEDEDSD